MARMTKTGKKKKAQDRLTITLGPGQRETLEGLAEHNNVKLALLVRCALDEFLGKYKDRQIALPFLRLLTEHTSHSKGR